MFQKILITLVGLFIFTSSSLAGCSASTSAGNCSAVTIDRLYLDGNTVFIGTSGDENAMSGFCAAGGYLRLLESHPLRDQIYALLLTVHKDRSNIWIRVESPSSGLCTIKYVVSDL